MATSVSLRKSFALAPRKLARYPKIGLVLPESQHCMTSDSRRLAILTAREINELYGLPCFTDQERCNCLIRAGFKLELEDETDPAVKHCEFSARVEDGEKILGGSQDAQRRRAAGQDKG
jgi:hypothetical protein